MEVAADKRKRARVAVSGPPVGVDQLSPQGRERLGAGLAAIPTGKRMPPISVCLREALTTPTGKPFCKAMVGLCRDLDIAVVAEMVENEDTVAFVRECGVHFAQGTRSAPRW